jgi:hypothetical protein
MSTFYILIISSLFYDFLVAFKRCKYDQATDNTSEDDDEDIPLSKLLEKRRQETNISCHTHTPAAQDVQKQQVVPSSLVTKMINRVIASDSDSDDDNLPLSKFIAMKSNQSASKRGESKLEQLNNQNQKALKKELNSIEEKSKLKGIYDFLHNGSFNLEILTMRQQTEGILNDFDLNKIEFVDSEDEISETINQNFHDSLFRSPCIELEKPANGDADNFTYSFKNLKRKKSSIRP